MTEIKLDVATNFDDAILEHIKSVDKKKQIVSLFGKLKYDIIGGGRSSISLPEVSLDDIDNYNKKCKDMNIRLNYLINPVCLGNRDIIPEEHKKIVDFIGMLYEMGIEWVTICSPYLFNIVKNQFPKMKITIGLYAYVNNIQDARSWIDMGANELTLMQSLTRDFGKLRLLLSEFKNYDVNFRLLANNGCLHTCPYSINHALAAAHSSANNDESLTKYFDYSLINCYLNKISKPTNVIASDWIRPEDLSYYEELCDETGNDRLVIKIVERTKSTKFLCNVISAYISRSYNGNLLDLFNWIGNDEATTSLDASGYAESLSTGNLNMNEFIKYSKFFKIPKMIVDNTKLDGFIEHFVRSYKCKDRLCWLENTELDNSSDNYCDYCHKWAKKVVSFAEPEDQEEWIKSAIELKNGFDSSRIFNLERSASA